MTYLIMWLLAVLLGAVGYKIGQSEFDFAESLGSAMLSLAILCLGTLGFAAWNWVDPLPLLGLMWAFACAVFGVGGLTLTVIAFVGDLWFFAGRKD